MEFGLLGPTWVHDGADSRPVPAAKQRVVLGSLLTRGGGVVSIDELIDDLWRDRPPAGAEITLRNHVMRLRRTLGPSAGERVRTRSPGYLIELEDGELDLHRLDTLAEQGLAALRDRRWDPAATVLRQAQRLWRGEPLVDVPCERLRSELLPYLEQTRFNLMEWRVEAELALGRHEELISELHKILPAAPLRERLHAHLMLALYRSGRVSEALAHYRDVSAILSRELGVAPSAELSELHRRMLTGDTTLDFESAANASATVNDDRTAESEPRQGHVANQLPADTRLFSGRADQLDQVIEIAETVASAPAGVPATVLAIDGMAGVGKSAFVVRAAHRIRDRFPDGQLFLDLHGYSDGPTPVTAQGALQRLLPALGVPAQSLPQDLDGLAALYRTRLSGTRTLVVLDNVLRIEQIRPLLPASEGSLVLVTSRSRLVSLDDAHWLTLDALPERDAVELLEVAGGSERVSTDAPVTRELAELCGRLPLALRIVAARLRQRPALSVDALVARLRDDRERLGHLQDRERDVTAVFDGSYNALDDQERLLLRRFGLLAGPDIDAYAAANLIDVDPRTAERLLESLAEHHLLIEHGPGRYKFHDLIRLYARERSSDDPAEQRESAFERIEAYYTQAATAAARHIARRSFPSSPLDGALPRPAPELADRATALAWMALEHTNLVALAGQRDTRESMVLLENLAVFLHTANEFSAAASVHERAGELARGLGLRLGEANALWCAGRTARMLADYSKSVSMLEQALDLYTELDSPLGRANCLVELGLAFDLSMDPAKSIATLERALAAFEQLGYAFGLVDALFSLGRARYTTGHYTDAMALLDRALAIAKEQGDLVGETNVLFGRGAILTQTGDLAQATSIFERILEIYLGLGDHYGAANALFQLSDLQRLSGAIPTATASCRRALTMYREIGYGKGEGDASALLSALRLAAGEPTDAIGLARHALAISEATTSIDSRAKALNRLGDALAAAGEGEEAAKTLEQALDAARALGSRQMEAAILNSTALTLVGLREPEAALAAYRQALETARGIPSPADEATALDGIRALTGGDE